MFALPANSPGTSPTRVRLYFFAFVPRIAGELMLHSSNRIPSTDNGLGVATAGSSVAGGCCSRDFGRSCFIAASPVVAIVCGGKIVICLYSTISCNVVVDVCVCICATATDHLQCWFVPSGGPSRQSAYARPCRQCHS